MDKPIEHMEASATHNSDWRIAVDIEDTETDKMRFRMINPLDVTKGTLRLDAAGTRRMAERLIEMADWLESQRPIEVGDWVTSGWAEVKVLYIHDDDNNSFYGKRSGAFGPAGYKGLAERKWKRVPAPEGES